MNIISIRAIGKKKVIKRGLSPAVLYHASPYKNLKLISPRNKTVRDPNEGPVIFATPDIAYASMFLGCHDDSWTRCGLFNNTHYFVTKDRKRFTNADNGGSIYDLPIDTFSCNLTMGGREKEWTSKVNVKPIGQTKYRSWFNTMINFWVQVYLIDNKTFRKLVNSKDHGLKLLRTIKSENQKLGVNVRSF